jgi:hypothetical protein
MGAAQHWVRSTHDRVVGRVAGAGMGSGSSLSSMNSFSLALLLGGLRGPLVMFLWMTSETQKNEKNLEDFDTRVEWIRLLQPEFDTVHIFQIWNKAYNISVQMASLANKYTTILDALEYARSVDRERPNNINIIAAIGGIYFDKLGSSSEKQYYSKRVRSESLPHKELQTLSRSDPAWRPLQLDVMLDEQGYLAGEGLKFKYLEPYQPFPYGLSPFAIGYDYYRQAQYLQNEKQQKHIQLSDLVIDSRSALAQKMWSDDEWERGRRQEMLLFNKAVPEERIDMELPTAEVKLDQPPSDALSPEQADAAFKEALYDYALAARLAQDGRVAYEDHLTRFADNRMTYTSHLEHLKAVQELILGDHDYLAAMRATGDERAALIKSAAEHYRASIPLNQQMILKYYTDQSIADAIGYNRDDVNTIPHDQYAELLRKAKVILANPQVTQYDNNREDRTEYENYVKRAEDRLKNLQ